MRPQLGGKDNPLSNEKVRQAMNYAANKEAIIQVVTHNVGSPLTSFMSSATPLHTGDKPLYPYDLEKAKSLMKEAGFENGFETSMLVLAGNQDEIGIATALQQMWGAIGIKLELQQVDNPSRTQQYRDGTFTMRVSAWTDDIADPNEISSYFVYSPTIDALHSGWKSEEADKLFEASQKEIDDSQACRAIRQDAGDLQRQRPDHPALRDAVPCGAEQEGAWLPADPARQQYLWRGVAREVDCRGRRGGRMRPPLATP